MKRSNSNPTSTLTKRRSFRGWLKRVTIPNGAASRKIGPDSTPKGGVFGIPLEMSIKYAKTTVGYVDDDGIKHTKAGAIPIVVAKCGSYLKKNGLETEGIFRISGNFKRVNALEFQFDQSASSYGLDLNWEGYTVHDAASVLRRYLNKLPDPVIPFDYYQKFRDVMNNNTYKSTEHRIEAFQKLVQCLPPPHQHLLLYLLDTLSLFATSASETKMDISNLAAVFCPGILRHPDHNTPVQYKISQYVIEFLVEFQSLFTMQLLVPTKRKKSSTASSSGGEVPPVPLLLPSSYPKQQPPPVPLHVVNPSAPSELSLSIKERNTSSLIESPLDINAPNQQDSIDAAVARESTAPANDVVSNNSQQSFMQKATKIATPYYHIMLQKLTESRQMLEPWIAKPAALLICISVLLVTLIIIAYEAYLAFTFCSFEPYLFFAGLVSYWSLLYKGLPPSPPSTPVAGAVNQVPNVPHQAVVDQLPMPDAVVPKNTEDEDMFPEAVMDADAEKAMMQDESIMSEWRDLLTRAWKVNESDDSDTKTISTATAADDMASVMSRSSRFNEEEDFAPAASVSSSEEDEDEELGFDPDTLEMYLSQYDQIKRDAELAKRLQIEEQKARDENNPFVVEDMAIGRSRSINTGSTSKEADDNHDNVTTPTNEKEEWKIRIFPR
ncbi:rho GTPase activator protein [Mucor ambiguus]|uniref:Rho GTPase activator protein n=1 Tax=Mucor ambiguus TaxID=91626 RepID=A0A0C9LUX8_9FUNG|nr:rho GTPase activator protein [Mucor ambiguus]